jgi:hypothetical protein
MSNYFMMQYRINLTSHLSNCAVGPGQPPLQKTQILPERSSEPMQCEALTTTSTGTCPNCPVGPHQPRAPLHVQDILGFPFPCRWPADAGCFPLRDRRRRGPSAMCRQRWEQAWFLHVLGHTCGSLGFLHFRFEPAASSVDPMEYGG